MHREGHVGIGFLLYSPFAYLFVSLEWYFMFGIGMAAIGAWSFLPDIDMGLPIRHRGPTHSIVFAAFAGLITAVAFGYLFTASTFQLGGPVAAGSAIGLLVVLAAGFTLAFLGVLGHIIGDVLTPMGVQPWWPRSGRAYSLDLVLAADKEANKQLSFIGALALTIALVIGEVGNPLA